MSPPKQRKIAIVGSRSVGRSHFSPSIDRTGLHRWGIVLGGGKLMRAGKSSLTVQFVDGHFVESYYPTIENTFSKVIKYKGQEYATEIIDTAGQVCSVAPVCNFVFRITCQATSDINRASI
jgi:hypothetical protein